MTEQAGMDKDAIFFICDRCGERFFMEEIVEEDDLLYCKLCFKTLMEEE